MTKTFKAFYTVEEVALLRQAGCKVIEGTTIYVFKNIGQLRKGWEDEYRRVETKEEVAATIDSLTFDDYLSCKINLQYQQLNLNMK